MAKDFAMELPEGESWRVSIDGQFRHYKNKKAAEKWCKQLRLEGKEPMVATYLKGEFNSQGDNVT